MRTLLPTALAWAACRIVPAIPDPFLLPRQLFFDSVKTVVVASASVVGDVAIADSALSYIEIHVEERLRQANLTVVPASEYAAIWNTIAQESGGFFDPYTGQRDEEKFQTATGRLFDSLLVRFEFDALVYPEIWEVEVPFAGGDARWAGTVQAVDGSIGYQGDVRAATLFVAVQDTAGNELYVNEAGIEVLEYMARGELTPLPDDALFADTAALSAAVSRALDPLVEGRAASPPGS